MNKSYLIKTATLKKKKLNQKNFPKNQVKLKWVKMQIGLLKKKISPIKQYCRNRSKMSKDNDFTNF